MASRAASKESPTYSTMKSRATKVFTILSLVKRILSALSCANSSLRDSTTLKNHRNAQNPRNKLLCFVEFWFVIFNEQHVLDSRLVIGLAEVQAIIEVAEHDKIY